MPTPFKEALQKLGSRGIVTADMSTSEWADVPLALRERAFFSARTTNAAYLQEVRDRVQKILDPQTAMRGGRPVTEGMDIATARTELRGILTSIGYDPGTKRGGIQDLSSDRRLNLVINHNVQAAQGYGNWLQGQADGVLAAFPAQELFRAEDREEPRPWLTRWAQAGGQVFGGRMIALKSDPIWEQISAFGTPWPPFDFNSGMWVRDVDRDEAEELGLLGRGEQVQPTVENFNEKLEASAQNLDPDLLSSLKESLGDQVHIDGNTIKWSGAPPTPRPLPRPTPAPVPAPARISTRIPSRRQLPALDDLAREYHAAPERKAQIIDQARERLSIPAEDRVPVALAMQTRVAEVKRDAKAGADIVSRYTAPELMRTTAVTVTAKGGRRAHYSPVKKAVELHRHSGASTAAHEIMHGVEVQNPQVLRASAEFLLQRGSGETPRPLRTLTGNAGYRYGESALEDKWKERNGSPYAGKIYSHRTNPDRPDQIWATEVLTMGVERLHADPIEFFTNDREWFTFVIRTLRQI